jgi:phage tail tape-measure protein
MEQYRATLETVMGDSQKAAEKLDWVKKYAAKTPFEIPELVESTVKLQAMGLEAEKMLPIAGDMAAVFASSGKTVGIATEAINDAMMGRQNLPPQLAIAA